MLQQQNSRLCLGHINDSTSSMAMAAVRGGAGPENIEDELVGAAMQISELRQETKKIKQKLGLALTARSEE